MATSIEDCQINALNRMMERYGKLFLHPSDFKEVKHDPNMFPASVLFKFKKDFVKPDMDEGFDKISRITFERQYNPAFMNKAIFLDYDGTLRKVPDDSEYKYPIDPSEIIIKPNVSETLKKYQSMGYILVGVSNQSGIAKGNLTKEMAEACFKETNRMLGVNIDFDYCPHGVPPVCYCRKPQAGIGVKFIWKYNLDPVKCIMVGDYTSDGTFARRLGMQYQDEKWFFK